MLDNTADTSLPRVAPRLAWLPGVELLWFLCALSMIGAFVSLVPVDQNDFWWHLKIGQLIAQQGTIPTTNMFAWTLPATQPYIYATWLGEWLFYALSWLGGLQLVVFARNLLALLAFGLVGLEARRRSGSWRLAGLAVLLAGAMTSNNLSARTQIWSWLPFALYALLLGRYAAGSVRARWLAALPLLMLFWVNAHGAFVLGIGLLGIYTLGETLRVLLRQEGALPWRRLRLLYLTLAATLLATLANPQGLGIFGYVRTLLTDAPSQQLIIEWQPPSPHSFAGGVFFATLLLIGASWALARRRPTLSDVLLFCAFGWLAIGGVRYVVWFGMAATPLLAQSLAWRNARSVPAPGNALGGLIALLLLAALISVQPWLKPQLSLPQPYKALFAPIPEAPELFAGNTPVQAAAYLRSHPGGRLFNEMGYGSYLIWALAPEQQVFIDTRIELFPYAQWQDYIAISDGQDYNRLLARYGADRLLLSRSKQAKLATALAGDAGWTREYQDDQAEIWRRSR